MKRIIVLTKKFSKQIDRLITSKSLLIQDFNDLKVDLSENPKLGDIVPGLHGVRKIRLKSATKGKRSGFRIIFYYYQKDEEIYLLIIYAKNEQEDLTMLEKKEIKIIINIIKSMVIYE